MSERRAFLVRLSDRNPDATPREVVEQHVDWLRRLHREGRLAICGPCDDGTAIIVLNCATLEEATEIALADPFREAGTVKTYQIVQMRLAGPHNDFLLNG